VIKSKHVTGEELNESAGENECIKIFGKRLLV
jgi:hypothetical protein